MIDKLKKFMVVAFLTLLIWTWAFLSLEQTLGPLTGSLEAAATTPPNLLISFLGEDNKSISDSLELNLTFKGAPTKTSDLSKRYREGKERLDFYYNPAEYGQTNPGVYTLSISDLVRKNLQVRNLALMVGACRPDRIQVRVEELVQKELTIEVRDENNNPVLHESIEPARIRMYVPPEYNGPAVVALTAQQMASARSASVRERPFVQFSNNRPPRRADQHVRIRLPSTEPLNDRVFQPKRIGFILPPDLQGRYRVELLNEGELKTINFKAADEAMQLYEQQPYHLLVQVQDGDENLDPIPPRPVIYNFPAEMVRRRLIQAPNPPVSAKIRLVPLTAGTPLP